MSDPSPFSTLFEKRALLAFGGVAATIAAAHSAGHGPTQAVLASLLLVGVPAATLLLDGLAGRVLVLFAAVGVWTSLPQEALDVSAIPVALLNRLGYVVVPPLILDLVLGERGWQRLRLEPVHVYGPTVVLGLGVLVLRVLRWNSDAPAAESGVRWAVGIYAACYLVLVMVAMLVRVGSGTEKPKPAPPQRATELEEAGRFGLASRVYEREGQIEKGARVAERAGEWSRAASLYRRAGEHFRAAEMFYRAMMLEDALDSYERAGDHAAAAGVCTRLGHVERAMALYEQAGDRAAAVRVLEEAGGKPTAEQLRRAGLFERAVQTYEAAGDWPRAAETSEHDLRDLPRAAVLYLKAGAFMQGGSHPRITGTPGGGGSGLRRTSGWDPGSGPPPAAPGPDSRGCRPAGAPAHFAAGQAGGRADAAARRPRDARGAASGRRAAHRPGPQAQGDRQRSALPAARARVPGEGPARPRRRGAADRDHAATGCA